MKNLITTLTILASLLFLFSSCSKEKNLSANATGIPAIISQDMIANVYQIGDTVGVILNERFSLIIYSSLQFNNFKVNEHFFDKTEMVGNNWTRFVYARTGGIYYNALPNTWFTGFNSTPAIDTIISGKSCAVNHVSRQVHFVNEFPTTANTEVNSLLNTTTDSVYYTVYLMDYKGVETGESVNGKCKIIYKPL